VVKREYDRLLSWQLVEFFGAGGLKVDESPGVSRTVRRTEIDPGILQIAEMPEAITTSEFGPFRSFGPMGLNVHVWRIHVRQRIT